MRLMDAEEAASTSQGDTAPLAYHLERTGPRAVLAAVDALFDRVEEGGPLVGRG